MRNRTGKYHNTKITTPDGTFDSKKEYNRYVELALLEKVGQIKNLERQVKFKLIPNQYVDGKLVERAVTYKADFVYEENGQSVVEDVKGFRTKEYILKRKMMRYLKGIEVREV